MIAHDYNYPNVIDPIEVGFAVPPYGPKVCPDKTRGSLKGGEAWKYHLSRRSRTAFHSIPQSKRLLNLAQTSPSTPRLLIPTDYLLYRLLSSATHSRPFTPALRNQISSTLTTTNTHNTTVAL